MSHVNPNLSDASTSSTITSNLQGKKRPFDETSLSELQKKRDLLAAFATTNPNLSSVSQDSDAKPPQKQVKRAPVVLDLRPDAPFCLTEVEAKTTPFIPRETNLTEEELEEEKLNDAKYVDWQKFVEISDSEDNVPSGDEPLCKQK